METVKCPVADCGAPIGGTMHRLCGDNAVAPEGAIAGLAVDIAPPPPLGEGRVTGDSPAALLLCCLAVLLSCCPATPVAGASWKQRVTGDSRPEGGERHALDCELHI